VGSRVPQLETKVVHTAQAVELVGTTDERTKQSTCEGESLC
jgi:hypothetical protein